MSESLKITLTALGAAGAVLFWFFTMNGLPPRVDKLEEQLRVQEARLTRNDVKLDIVLDDVKTIKNILMQLRSN